MVDIHPSSVLETSWVASHDYINRHSERYWVDMESGSRTTVFILSYNRPETLKEAVNSLLDQSLLPDKIVILDNCSSPENMKKIMNLSGSRVTVVPAEINHSSTWNINRAITYANNLYNNEYIYIMHDDDRVLPKFIEIIISLLDGHPEASAAYPNGYTMDKTGNRTGKVGKEEDEGYGILGNQKDVSLSYARGHSIPFPFVVYRNECLQRMVIDVDLGILIDVAFICSIAAEGSILRSHIRLTEYRVHGNQESSQIDEGLLDRRDDFLISIVANDAHYRSLVERNLGIRKAERLLKSVLSHHMIGYGLDWGSVLTLYKKRRVRLRYVPIVVLWMIKRRIEA